MLQDKLQELTVRSPFALTSLSCSQAVAKEFDILSRPYFELSSQPASASTWLVTTESDVPDGLTNQEVASSGEEPIKYRVDFAARRLYHVQPRSNDWKVQSLLRATRAIHRTEAAKAGMLFLHGGLMKLDGLGILLVGGSRSGKTTLILSAALRQRGTLVCNDDVGVVLNQSGGLHGVGWPRSVSVRTDSLAVVLGGEPTGVTPSTLRHPANRTIGTLRESGEEPHGTLLLYLDEYETVTGAPIQRSTEIDAVVHLSLANDLNDVDARVLSRSEHSQLLKAQVMQEPNKHLNIFGAVDPHQPQVSMEALAGLPAFNFRYLFSQAPRAVDDLADFVANFLASQRS